MFQLLREIARGMKRFERLAGCLPDPRDPALIEHDQSTLVRAADHGHRQHELEARATTRFRAENNVICISKYSF